MDLQRGTFNSLSRFSEDDPPCISKFQKKAYPQLKRKLFEAELDADDLVQVCLRIKPSNDRNNLYEIRDDQSLITYGDTTTAGHGRRTQNNVSKLYKFSHIFGSDATQKEIFNLIVKNNLQKLADGQSYTLLTYGASGSGKTYTLMGTENEPGLVPRSLEYIFKIVDAAQQPVFKPLDGKSEKLRTDQQSNEIQWVTKLRQVSAPVKEKYRRMSVQLSSDFTQSTLDLSSRTYYYVWVSFVEIYNEAIYDLLVPGDRRTMSKLMIREDTSGYVYVKGAHQAFVRSGAEAYDVMAAGRHNLQVAATGVHANSSRSHCIFTITMLADTPEGVRTSCVRLCDLAGSERAKSTRNTGARMAESRAINTSLHVLERCLHARRQQRPDARVPYRESKLTRLLGSGLSGGEPVTMLVTVNPSPIYIHETRHVLQLAAVARDIQINNTVYESSSTINSSEDLSISNEELMKLRADNERLHYELVQSMENNKELQNLIEEKRISHAKEFKETVEEVKNMSQQYYEANLQSVKELHKAEMHELLTELQQERNAKTSLMEQLQQTIVRLEFNMKKEDMNEIKRIIRQLRNIVIDKDEYDEIQFVNVEENDLSKSYVSEDKHDESRSYIRQTYSSVISSPLRISNSIIDNNDSRYSVRKTFNTPENYDKNDESIANESNRNDKSNEDLLHLDDESYTSNTEEINDNKKSLSECNVNNDSMSIHPKEIDNEHIGDSNKSVTEDEVFLTTDPNKVDLSDSITHDKKDLDNDKVVTENLSKISEEHSSFTKSKTMSNDANLTNIFIRDSKDGSLMLFEDAEMAVNKEMEKQNYDANLTYMSMRDSNFENGSLMSFEDAEDAVNKEVALENKQIPTRSSFFKFTKKDSYFENFNNNVNIKKEPITPKFNSRSPSLTNDDTPVTHCNTVIKKMLPIKERFSDVFEEKCVDTKLETEEDNIKVQEQIDTIKKTIDQLTLVSAHKKNKKYFSLSDDSGVADNIIKDSTESFSKTDSDLSENKFTDSTVTDQENTLDQFDNLYKDVTSSDLTHFDALLTSQDTINNQEKKNNEQEISAEDKSEIKKDTKRSKRNLRPRRCKNLQDGEENDNKIKNLQKEFSDVTLNKPVAPKVVPDIPSPEITAENEENIPPNELMSCPSKSILRSRRKLFTPRAEPVDQSPDSGGRPLVPRPSYCRARRRLQ